MCCFLHIKKSRGLKQCNRGIPAFFAGSLLALAARVYTQIVFPSILSAAPLVNKTSLVFLGKFALGSRQGWWDKGWKREAGE
jgi:hypothetical protein